MAQFGWFSLRNNFNLHDKCTWHSLGGFHQETTSIFMTSAHGTVWMDSLITYSVQDIHSGQTSVFMTGAHGTIWMRGRVGVSFIYEHTLQSICSRTHAVETPPFLTSISGRHSHVPMAEGGTKKARQQGASLSAPCQVSSSGLPVLNPNESLSFPEFVVPIPAAAWAPAPRQATSS